MNDDNQLMKEFMDSLKEDSPENITPYKASTNMNVQLGNPNFKMNNSMAVNIKENPAIVNPNNRNIVDKEFGEIQKRNIEQQNSKNNLNLPISESNIEKKDTGVSSELKFVILLALVLLIVVLFLIPSLSDILNNLFIN